MIHHDDISPVALRRLIKRKKIIYAGNARLKIYGLLNCKSGKRMLKKNRVFFSHEEEAIKANFRPCGHCLYKKFIDHKRRRC